MKMKSSTCDGAINAFIVDENYRVLEDGTILTRISSQGHLTNFWRVKPLTKRSDGYLVITYKGSNLRVHRIIYSAFEGSLKKDRQINHIDGNPQNNHVSNLEQVTPRQNTLHAFRVLKRPPHIGNAKISKDIAKEIRRQVGEENRRACDLAREFNVSASTVSGILKGKIWK